MAKKFKEFPGSTKALSAITKLHVYWILLPSSGHYQTTTSWFSILKISAFASQRSATHYPSVSTAVRQFCPWCRQQTVWCWEPRSTCRRWRTTCSPWRWCWRRGSRSREETKSTSTSCCPAPWTTPPQVQSQTSSLQGLKHCCCIQCSWDRLEEECPKYRAFLDIFTRTAEPLILEVMALPFCAVCVKCDMQERLISPVLTPLHPTLRVQTESVADFHPATKGTANQIQAPHRLRAIK